MHQNRLDIGPGGGVNQVGIGVIEG
jgi:hypothetical protein